MMTWQGLFTHRHAHSRIHAHPTLAEVVKEAALAVDGRALHI